MWGKLGGAGVGLAIGGPIGALIGLIAGHLLVDRSGALLGAPDRSVLFSTGLFELAKSTTAGFEAYAKQLAELFADEPALLEDVLDGLFHVAAADGILHEAEHDYLCAVSAIFGFDQARYDQIEARHVHRADDPYRILGVNRSMSLAEIRSRFMRLVAEHHPDRAIARGLPPDAISIATDRMARLNAAWDRICDERRDEASAALAKASGEA
jgi:DnaJ like chaperone protein